MAMVDGLMTKADGRTTKAPDPWPVPDGLTTKADGPMPKAVK
jgi:hypothetical protein